MAKLSHLWDPRVKLTLDVEIITTYLIRVACVHNLPSLVIPVEGTTIDQAKACPFRRMWLHE